MKTDRLTDLANRMLDSELTPDEQAELDRMIGEDANACKYVQNLQEVHSSLQQLEQIDPPETMKQGILSSIQITSKQSSSSWISGIARTARARLQTKVVVVFSVGVVAGLVLFAGLNALQMERRLLTSTLLSGTIGAGAYDAEVSEIIHTMKISDNDVQGTIVTHTDDGTIWAMIEIVSETDVTVIVRFDGPSVTLTGVTPRVPGSQLLTVEPEMVSVTHSGNQEYVLAFDRDAAAEQTLVYQIYRESVLFEEAVRIRTDSSGPDEKE